jgi:hypothetical protein
LSLFGLAAAGERRPDANSSGLTGQDCAELADGFLSLFFGDTYMLLWKEGGARSDRLIAHFKSMVRASLVHGRRHRGDALAAAVVAH